MNKLLLLLLFIANISYATPNPPTNLTIIDYNKLKFTDELTTLDLVKRSDWVNVKDFGAIGNGIADDTIAIQNAINTIPDSWRGPKVVYLPKGIYKITNTISKSEITGFSLIGHGADTTIIWDGPQDGRMFWSNGNTRGNYIGIVWDGAGIAGVGIDHDSKSRYETRIMHEYMEFRNFTIAGIRVGHDQVKASAEMYYKNNKFINNKNGVLFLSYNDYNNVFDGNHFINNEYGINNQKGNFNIRNSRFENSKIADLYLHAHSFSARRVVSKGSNAFIHTQRGASATIPLRVENCLIDGWKDPNGAIVTGQRGPILIFDTKFINAPSTNAPIALINPSYISQTALLGNVSSPDTNTLINRGASSNYVHYLDLDTEGYDPINDRNFLISKYNTSEILLDVKEDCGAYGNGSANDTTAIQKCLNLASTYERPTTLYFPAGKYNVYNTLEVPANSKFYIEGVGRLSRLNWSGEKEGTLLHIHNPDNMKVERITFHRGNSERFYSIRQTDDKPSSIHYHNVFPTWNETWGGTIYFDNLSAGTTVTAWHLDGLYRINNSSEARILIGFAPFTDITIEGTTPQTGFLGILSAVSSQNDYIIKILDNQSLVMTDWYSEQSQKLIYVEGNNSDKGQIIIDHTKAGNTDLRAITINNYKGLLANTGALFGIPSLYESKEIYATNSPNLNLLLIGNHIWNYPLTTTGISSVSRLGNVINNREDNFYIDKDIKSNTFTQDLNQMIKAFRKLGTLDIELNYE